MRITATFALRDRGWSRSLPLLAARPGRDRHLPARYTRTMDTNQIGAITEGKVLAALMGTGLVVAVPFGVARYDLVLETTEGFKRIQCKTGRIRNGVIRFNCYSIRGNRTQRFERRTYENDADFFGVYCAGTDKVYLVPIGLYNNEGYLRVDPCKNGRTKGVLWAKDYEVQDERRGDG